MAGLLLLIASVYGANMLGLDIMARFGVARENIQTDIYRESKSYIEGTIRDLRDLKVKYVTAAADVKPSIASLIRQRAGELDWDNLPSDLSTFIKELN